MAQIFYYELPFDYQHDPSNDNEVPADIPNQWVAQHPDLPIRRGDILCLEHANRNCASFIWDGNQAIPLDTSVDEYGNVPRGFFVLDPEDGPAPGLRFTLNHWSSPRIVFGTQDSRRPVHHNDYAWIRLTNQEITTIKSQPIYFDDQDQVYYTNVILRGGFDFFLCSHLEDFNNWDLNQPLCVSVNNHLDYLPYLDDADGKPIIMVDV